MYFNILIAKDGIYKDDMGNENVSMYKSIWNNNDNNNNKRPYIQLYAYICL